MHTYIHDINRHNTPLNTQQQPLTIIPEPLTHNQTKHMWYHKQDKPANKHSHNI